MTHHRSPGIEPLAPADKWDALNYWFRAFLRSWRLGDRQAGLRAQRELRRLGVSVCLKAGPGGGR